MIDEYEVQWMESVRECENDTFAFAMGFLISQLVRFVICGRWAALHGSPTGHSEREVEWLFGFSFIFMISMVWLTVEVKKRGKTDADIDRADTQIELRGEVRHTHPRAWLLSQTVASMMTAWCLLFAGEWLFYRLARNISITLGLVVLAFVITLICVLLIFVLDFFADRGEVNIKAVRTVIHCLGVLVGLAWEKAFHTAVEGVVEGTGLQKSSGPFGVTALALGLVAMVLPAWRWYILPRALAEVEMRVMKRDPF